MCTKELAALTTVLLLAIGCLISISSMAGVARWFQPTAPPAKSVLANFEWQNPRSTDSITEAAIDDYQRDGFGVFRGVIDPKAVAIVLEEAQRLCKPQFWMSKVCQIEEGRWQSDVIRDFLFYSPIGDLVNKLIRDARRPALRVYQDGIVGYTSSILQPLFFSFTKHIDHGGMQGVWHGLHSDTQGVGLWIPLQELDPEVTGGSIELYPNFTRHGCQVIWGERSTVDGFDDSLNHTKIHMQCYRHRNDSLTYKPAVSPGDVVAWWPSALHKSQRILREKFTRYALYVRVVTNETLVCLPKDCGWKGRPCCNSPTLKSGSYLRTPCFPQVWPEPLPQELKAHFGPKPDPLIDRRMVVSKYSTNMESAVHQLCKKHRQGGPRKFWLALKKAAPEPEHWRFPTLDATEFYCGVATHEGECWRLDPTGLDWSIVPWYFVNYSSSGVPLYFSKDHEDVEIGLRVPWQANITAVEEGDWLAVGDFYASKKWFGAGFVRLQEADADAATATPSNDSVTEGLSEALAAAKAEQFYWEHGYAEDSPEAVVAEIIRHVEADASPLEATAPTEEESEEAEEVQARIEEFLEQGGDPEDLLKLLQGDAGEGEENPEATPGDGGGREHGGRTEPGEDESFLPHSQEMRHDAAEL